MSNRIPPLVTVFGGGGFVGRYVVEALCKAGARVRVAQRTPKSAYFLQPLGSVGQIDILRCDVNDAEAVAAAVSGADAVINLVAIMGGAMQRVNVDGARTIAGAAADAGVDALVQVSAIGADANGASLYARSKGAAEQAVRDAFARATIIRPSLVFGPEDQLTNRFAGLLAMLPAYPVIAPGTRFQPIYVRDLGRAIPAAALDPARHAGQTYEVGGPEVMTMRELTARIAALSGQDRALIDLPDAVSGIIAKFGFLPGAPLTSDQWLMLQQDNVASGDGLAAFGIEPSSLGAVGGEWLGRFREGGRFAAQPTQLAS